MRQVKVPPHRMCRSVNMITRLVAIVLLALLAVLPAVGEASAVPAVAHCASAADAMTAGTSQGHDHKAVKQDCDHGSSHRPIPCAMMGLCSMTGCMAFTGIATPQVLSAGQRVAFVVPAVHRLDGLALPPPLEPPRA